LVLFKAVRLNRRKKHLLHIDATRLQREGRGGPFAKWAANPDFGHHVVLTRAVR